MLQFDVLDLFMQSHIDLLADGLGKWIGVAEIFGAALRIERGAQFGVAALVQRKAPDQGGREQMADGRPDREQDGEGRQRSVRIGNVQARSRNQPISG